MPPAYADDLVKLLAQHRPVSILAIGAPVQELVASYLEREPQTQLDRLEGPDLLAALRGRGRYALCLVADTLEHMSKEAAGQLIARLRDVHAERLYVVVPIGEGRQGAASRWELSELIGYGLRAIADYAEGAEHLQLFEFDIATYKDTPDWLNANYWAHPERWDKERW